MASPIGSSALFCTSKFGFRTFDIFFCFFFTSLVHESFFIDKIVVAVLELSCVRMLDAPFTGPRSW